MAKGFDIPALKEHYFQSHDDDGTVFPRTSRATSQRDERDMAIDGVYRDDTAHGASTFTHEEGGMCFVDEDGNKGNEIYFVGIIDILQRYKKEKVPTAWPLV
eukprot:TRINITY_DN2943_c0_g1_i1.p1 TRINITY_DN2943_c0_g1~~TRINITY_DN2943_c0_g1_i1.p1  ORF type:complete len:102 (-),score=26.60 TRINITY_DN2943_c0_g1_i1:28-333(-)